MGVLVSNVGDLPQLTGAPNSMSGIDMHIIDVSSRVNNVYNRDADISISGATVGVLVLSVVSSERKRKFT